MNKHVLRTRLVCTEEFIFGNIYILASNSTKNSSNQTKTEHFKPKWSTELLSSFLQRHDTVYVKKPRSNGGPHARVM